MQNKRYFYIVIGGCLIYALAGWLHCSLGYNDLWVAVLALGGLTIIGVSLLVLVVKGEEHGHKDSYK